MEWRNAYAFIDNHRFIAETNRKNRDLGLDLRLEVNTYADMHYDDFIKVRGGFTGVKKNVGHFTNEHYEGTVFPTAFDWRNEAGVLAPVQDQGQCGSCWAFSATCALESGYGLHVGKSVAKLSEQELVDCEKTDFGCNGGLMDHAFAWVETNGMTSESQIPYKAVDETCTYKKSMALVFNKGYVDVDATDAALKAAVAVCPVSIGVAAGNSWQFYNSGVMTFAQCPDDQLDHGVVLAGYTDGASAYWIVRNSWGASWGNAGYVYLEMGKNTCGLRNTASYPTFA